MALLCLNSWGRAMREVATPGDMQRKIDEALERIDSGEFGICESCGAEIGDKRLEARPTATLCIDCKTLEEVRERQVAK